METIVKPWFALIVVVLLVETIFASAFATADAIGVTSPTTTSYTNSYSTGYNSYSSSSGFANSPSSSSYVNYQSTPNYQTYYSGSQVSTYWPILGDAQTCQNRQDIMLHVAPFGCQPVVVRSDLLEEQNVPIFCQLDALKINPLLDIDQIRSINFAGNYPPEILDVGFHPAMAALRTHDQLLGSPSINNVGYVVVVLKRTPKESDMPESVNVTLNARIDYLAGNALGIGRAEFILKPVSETDWNNEKVKQSFWSGRYFVKLEDANPNYATVSIYYGDRKVITTRIDRGTTSRAVYVPGMYCNAGLQIAYDGFTDANKKAQIQIASSTGTDTFDVYEGSRFLDDRCYVSRIDIDQNGETGNVSGSCGNARFDLSLQPRGSQLFDAFVVNGVIKEPEFSNGKYQVDLRENKDSSKKGLYVLDESNRLLTFGSDGKEVVFVDSSGLSNDIIINNEKKSKEWVRKVYDSLLQYKNKRTIDSTYSIGNIIDKKNSPDTFAKVSGAISAYEKVADDYPSEREIDSNIANRYGEEALKRA
ncbi:MAG: hypothetical protein Q7S74_03075, partial [Nanoarchaeota archaeon]|nr:hypothetical protein [Nanoarchaeota archaeon]